MPTEALTVLKSISHFHIDISIPFLYRNQHQEPTEAMQRTRGIHRQSLAGSGYQTARSTLTRKCLLFLWVASYANRPLNVSSSLLPGQHIHESRLAGTTDPHQGCQHSWPEGPTYIFGPISLRSRLVLSFPTISCQVCKGK